RRHCSAIGRTQWSARAAEAAWCEPARATRAATAGPTPAARECDCVTTGEEASYSSLASSQPRVALPTIELAADGGLVGFGGSGAHYMTATDGSRWIMKASYFGGQQHRYLC